MIPITFINYCACLGTSQFWNNMLKCWWACFQQLWQYILKYNMKTQIFQRQIMVNPFPFEQKKWAATCDIQQCGILTSVDSGEPVLTPYSFCFVWFDSLRPINNLSVMKGRVFLGWTSTKLGLTFLLKDTKQWHLWGSSLRPLGLKSSTLPLHSPSLQL